MPVSRKRKTRRGGGASRATYSSKNRSSKRNIIIAAAIVAVLVIASVVFVVLQSGGSSGEITTASGLKYVDEVVGTGVSPSPGKTVTVHYTGTLQDGTKFDSSVDRGQPFEFLIGKGAVIKGWDEGVMTMKVGGKRRLIVPPELGYGPRASPKIPANSPLFFEVELLGVK